jgi:hypothetical protein
MRQAIWIKPRASPAFSGNLPQYTSINGNYFDAYSNYNSMQLSFRKRFAHGFSLANPSP